MRIVRSIAINLLMPSMTYSYVRVMQVITTVFFITHSRLLDSTSIAVVQSTLFSGLTSLLTLYANNCVYAIYVFI